MQLVDGSMYYPDIIDKSAKLVYEVHWKAERKEEAFDKLPEGWKGVNVFIDDSSSPYSVVVKMPGFRFVMIADDKLSNF